MSEERFYSIDIATQIGQISRGQAANWARNGTFVPSILYWTDSRPFSYLYSFADLVALRLISVLRHEYGMSLPTAVAAASQFRDTSNNKWSEKRFQLADLVNVHSPKGDFKDDWINLGEVAADVREEAEKLWNRGPEDYGKVERKRNVMHGALVVKGTRIPVSTVVALVNAGWDVKRIRRGYPTLQPEDIRGVMQYVEEQQQVA